jgi:hypothetical protein
LDIALDLGRPVDEQQLDRWLKPGRKGNPGPRLDSAALTKRYATTLPEWYTALLQESDSLLITREQMDALVSARAAYLLKLAAHWGAHARYMASVPDDYNSAETLRRHVEAVDGAWRIAWEEAHSVLPKILTPIQLRMLPGYAGIFYRAKEPIKGGRYFGA